MKGDQLKLMRVHRTNELKLRIERAVCATDGIDCSDCPVQERCQEMWDNLQENTQTCLSGIPGRYIGTYLRWFAELRREKWEKHNQLVAARGGNHGDPVR